AGVAADARPAAGPAARRRAEPAAARPARARPGAPRRAAGRPVAARPEGAGPARRAALLPAGDGGPAARRRQAADRRPDARALHRADALASGRGLDHVVYAERKRAEWEASGKLDPPPLVTGEDLIAMGLTPGPLFKTLLDRVREAQLDEVIDTAEQARAIVRH